MNSSRRRAALAAAVLAGAAALLDATLVKAGPGALELTAANTYTGTTSVNNGTLILSGTHTGGGAYTVGDRVHVAALAGTGVTTSSVKVVDQGIIAPGDAGPNDVGTLSTASLTLDQGSTYSADINFTTGSSDQIQVSGGTVSLDGNLRMQFVGFDSSAVANTRTFVIIHIPDPNAAPVNGHFRDIMPATTELATVSVDYAYNGDGDGKFNDVAVTFSAVPEPASVTTVTAGAALMLRRSRRRRHRRPRGAQRPAVV